MDIGEVRRVVRVVPEVAPAGPAVEEPNPRAVPVPEREPALVPA